MGLESLDSSIADQIAAYVALTTSIEVASISKCWVSIRTEFNMFLPQRKTTADTFDSPNVVV
jgi:hypothetical protein